MPSFADRTEPAYSAAAVTPSDSVALSTTSTGLPCRGLFIGTGGDVAVKLANDTVAVTFKNVSSGSLLPLCALYVMATNTTATDIVALL